MMISVQGIGWLTKDEYGCIARGERSSYDGGTGPDPLRDRLFPRPVKNFGRFDRLSRMACSGVALALRDAGIEDSQKRDIGLIGTNREGSLRTDLDYFRDYIKGGRTLSRGNLFIYTLPSSPLGEAAIHFGLLGPLLYVVDQGHSLAPLLDLAAEMIENREASLMLAGTAAEEEALFLVIGKDGAGPAGDLCSLPDARAVVLSAPGVPGIVQKISFMGIRKGVV
jgi:3-oxoacyl-[acyl-carrier-protein] synthase II